MTNGLTFNQMFGEYSAFIGSGYGLTLLILVSCLFGAIVKHRHLRRKLEQDKSETS